MEAKIIQKKSKGNWDIKIQYLTSKYTWQDKATFRWWFSAIKCINQITEKDDRILINTERVTPLELTEITIRIKNK